MRQQKTHHLWHPVSEVRDDLLITAIRRSALQQAGSALSKHKTLPDTVLCTATCTIIGSAQSSDAELEFTSDLHTMRQPTSRLSTSFNKLAVNRQEPSENE